MFIGREKELSALTAELSNWKKKTAVLIYGKRRVGKSTLIMEATKSFDYPYWESIYLLIDQIPFVFVNRYFFMKR